MRGSLRRYRWWITLAVLCLWTFAAHYEAAASDRAYAECESHPARLVFYPIAIGLFLLLDMALRAHGH